MLQIRSKTSQFAALLLLLFFSSCTSYSPITGAMGQSTDSSSSYDPTSGEINAGLKEALEKATGISTERLSAKDGYLGNLDVKILFPEEAKNIENTLRSIGLGSLVDQVITSVNRAAEEAAIEAKPIFENAIRQMNITDVKNILLGEHDAATQYFNKSTSPQLTEKFSPIIDSSLKKTDATKYWSDVMSNYNKVPFVKKVDTDLTAYVTKKAIEGLFVEIAKEEVKIRESISSRTTPLLKKVFGYAAEEEKK